MSAASLPPAVLAVSDSEDDSTRFGTPPKQELSRVEIPYRVELPFAGVASARAQLDARVEEEWDDIFKQLEGDAKSHGSLGCDGDGHKLRWVVIARLCIALTGLFLLFLGISILGGPLSVETLLSMRAGAICFLVGIFFLLLAMGAIELLLRFLLEFLGEL